ncbi:hypothetical protein [Reichenbachiella sp. MALMAid0571]|uniref:hypothetical protein n=1 Tax=Reichenbachiella sp. MALMAid0571 TaxID=3143939 RepID=UPI0032DF4D2C
MKLEELKSEVLILALILFSMCVVVLAWTFYPHLIFHVNHDSIQNIKQVDIGSRYWNLETLFSGLAFSVIFVSLWVQKESLNKSIQEMRKSTSELVKQNRIQLLMHSKLNPPKLYQDEITVYPEKSMLNEKNKAVFILKNLGGNIHSLLFTVTQNNISFEVSNAEYIYSNHYFMLHVIFKKWSKLYEQNQEIPIGKVTMVDEFGFKYFQDIVYHGSGNALEFKEVNFDIENSLL